MFCLVMFIFDRISGEKNSWHGSNKRGQISRQAWIKKSMWEQLPNLPIFSAFWEDISLFRTNRWKLHFLLCLIFFIFNRISGEKHSWRGSGIRVQISRRAWRLVVDNQLKDNLVVGLILFVAVGFKLDISLLPRQTEYSIQQYSIRVRGNIHALPFLAKKLTMCEVAIF